MNPTLQNLINAYLDDKTWTPELRFVLADCMEENGDDRADWIRLWRTIKEDNRQKDYGYWLLFHPQQYGHSYGQKDILEDVIKHHVRAVLLHPDFPRNPAVGDLHYEGIETYSDKMNIWMWSGDKWYTLHSK